MSLLHQLNHVITAAFLSTWHHLVLPFPKPCYSLPDHSLSYPTSSQWFFVVAQIGKSCFLFYLDILALVAVKEWVPDFWGFLLFYFRSSSKLREWILTHWDRGGLWREGIGKIMYMTLETSWMLLYLFSGSAWLIIWVYNQEDNKVPIKEILRVGSQVYYKEMQGSDMV
jgi:hypothetical protein